MKNSRSFLRFAFSALTIFNYLSPSDVALAANPPQSRIIGGSDAQNGEFPWAGILIKNVYNSASGQFIGRSSCGSSLIAPSWIITAAHCVVDDPGTYSTDMTVKIGEVDQTISNGDIRRITQKIVHPSYNPFNFNNDIALLKLESPSSFSPLYLPDTDVASGITTGSFLTTVGWGATQFGSGTRILQKISLNAVHQATCESQYRQSPSGLRVNENMLCASAIGRDSCQGDSGGPLMISSGGLYPRYFFAGLTSFGEGCANPNFSGVYTRITKYIAWINSNITDTLLPEVTPLSPITGQQASGQLSLIANVLDNLTIDRVRFLIDGRLVKEIRDTNYSHTIDTYQYSNGSHVFTIQAFDAKGNLKSETVNFTIRNTPPIITEQPRSIVSDINSSTTFRVTASGPELRYQWQQKRKGTNTWVNIANQTSSTYSFTTLSGHSGNGYRVKISNLLGDTTSSGALVTAIQPLRITTNPVNKSSNVNTNVTFSVRATGTSPNYQWQYRKNANAPWANISQATRASYAVRASILKAGQYRVRVFNSHGREIFSQPANLTIR
jgi:secreted trypsin-like serine protease